MAIFISLLKSKYQCVSLQDPPFLTDLVKNKGGYLECPYVFLYIFFKIQKTRGGVLDCYPLMRTLLIFNLILSILGAFFKLTIVVAQKEVIFKALFCYFHPFMLNRPVELYLPIFY